MGTPAFTPTPGPWHFDRDEETVVAEVGAVIASICMAADFPCLERERVDEVDLECVANAHLIAAAPELYEMAERLERILIYELAKAEKNNPEDDEGIRLLRLNLDLVQDALAKARGEQQ